MTHRVHVSSAINDSEAGPCSLSIAPELEALSHRQQAASAHPANITRPFGSENGRSGTTTVDKSRLWTNSTTNATKSKVNQVKQTCNEAKLQPFLFSHELYSLQLEKEQLCLKRYIFNVHFNVHFQRYNLTKRVTLFLFAVDP